MKVTLYPSGTFIYKLLVYVMVKIKKSTEELNAYLSCVYISCTKSIEKMNKKIRKKSNLCNALDTVLISIVGSNPLILFQFLRDERT